MCDQLGVKPVSRRHPMMSVVAAEDGWPRCSTTHQPDAPRCRFMALRDRDRPLTWWSWRRKETPRAQPNWGVTRAHRRRVSGRNGARFGSMRLGKSDRPTVHQRSSTLPDVREPEADQSQLRRKLRLMGVQEAGGDFDSLL